MILTCTCGSDKWTGTVELNVGYTVPAVTLAGLVTYDRDHPDYAPKCAQCGEPLPSFDELMAAKNEKRHPFGRKP